MKRVCNTLNGIIHYTVAGLVKQEERYLLIERATFPYGWGCVAGHIDEEDATAEEALRREFKEELGCMSFMRMLFTRT